MLQNTSMKHVSLSFMVGFTSYSGVLSLTQKDSAKDSLCDKVKNGMKRLDNELRVYIARNATNNKVQEKAWPCMSSK
jgi:hypothetical protein